MSSRDQHRKANASEKQAVYLIQEGLCHSCKRPLIMGDVEFHHVIRWSDGGVTDELNIVALCRGCHRNIHRELPSV
jgi:5-methylcytosine-specific restriction endonuclease McrA